MTPATNRSARKAFTLIEMAVVIAIVLFLAGLTYLMFPSQASRKMVTAGNNLTGWLLVAKQQAKRDNRATGVRFITDPTNANNFIQLIYVQQPDDFAPAGSTCNCQGGPTVTFQPAGVLVGSAAVGGQADVAPVAAGDYIEFYHSGGVFSILSVDPAGSSLTLQGNGPTMAAGAAGPYRIIRQPRPLLGEEDLNLPDGTAIYSPGCSNLPQRTVGATSFVEVVFSPAGNVIGQGATQDKVYLWIYDADILAPDQPSSALPVNGQPPFLITVQMRSGLIGIYPVSTGADPYFEAKKGQSSGM
jgi:prepilin-type N-terminal cleavage/methylation domain-containing protein